MDRIDRPAHPLSRFVLPVAVAGSIVVAAGISRAQSERSSEGASDQETGTRSESSLRSLVYKSPGVAAMLSLTPVPIDFGNLWTENIEWATAYTALEVGLAGSMMWVAAPHLCHGYGDEGCAGGWSTSRRNTMIGLALAYSGVKLAAAVQAAGAAEDYNERNARPWAMVAPIQGGATAAFGLAF